MVVLVFIVFFDSPLSRRLKTRFDFYVNKVARSLMEEVLHVPNKKT